MVALVVVTVVAVVGRGIVTPPPVAPPVPAVVAEATATATLVPTASAASPARVVLILPHGPIATLVDDELFVSGTVSAGVDAIDVTVTDIASSLVGQASIGRDSPAAGEFQANVPIRDVQRTQWLFIEIAAVDSTGAPLEVVRRAVQVASLDPTA